MEPVKTKIEDTKKVSSYFPLNLLAKLQKSARDNRRSFNQEIMWRLEQSFIVDNSSKIVVEK
jgi:hypothetical protein